MTQNLKSDLQLQKQYFREGHTRPSSSRVKQLGKLHQVIQGAEASIFAALKKDLGKPNFESYGTELGLLLRRIGHMKKDVRRYSKPVNHGLEKLVPLARSKVYREPLGHVLVISPWNYPLLLSLEPVAAAWMAGNVASLKPSELTPHTSEVMKDLLHNNFPEGLVRVFPGGPEVAKAILEQKFNHIFFTGSARVGRLVMSAASRHLTPVTLELGGKSPAIVDASAQLELSARRIIWGKCLNAGQTCVAPDYVLVHKNIAAKFKEELKKNIQDFFGDEVRASLDYGRIVNEAHFDRLSGLLEKAPVYFGGRTNREELFIEPTIIDAVPNDHAIMKEEIFGPLLPVLEFDSEREVIEAVSNNPDPLALYVFSKNKKFVDKIMAEIPFGGGCVNDTIIHLASDNLPFGGRGESGIGAYHGLKSFLNFTHEKSVLQSPTLMDPSFRYPPYGDKLKLLRKFLG